MIGSRSSPPEDTGTSWLEAGGQIRTWGDPQDPSPAWGGLTLDCEVGCGVACARHARSSGKRPAVQTGGPIAPARRLEVRPTGAPRWHLKPWRGLGCEVPADRPLVPPPLARAPPQPGPHPGPPSAQACGTEPLSPCPDPPQSTLDLGYLWPLVLIISKHNHIIIIIIIVIITLSAPPSDWLLLDASPWESKPHPQICF